MSRRYTDADHERVRELGKTHILPEVSQITQISEATLRRWRRNHGIQFVQRTSTYTPPHPQEKHLEAREASPVCHTWPELELMVGVPAETLSKWAKKECWGEHLRKGMFAGGCEHCKHPLKHECNGRDVCHCCNDALVLPEHVQQPPGVEFSWPKPYRRWWELGEPSPLMLAARMLGGA